MALPYETDRSADLVGYKPGTFLLAVVASQCLVKYNFCSQNRKVFDPRLELAYETYHSHHTEHCHLPVTSDNKTSRINQMALQWRCIKT